MCLKPFLKNISEGNFLKVLLYGAKEFSFKIKYEILKCAIKFIKKNRSLWWPITSFLIFFPLTKYLVFNILICIFCSIYVQNLQCKFCVLCCLVLLLLFLIALLVDVFCYDRKKRISIKKHQIKEHTLLYLFSSLIEVEHPLKTSNKKTHV